MEEIRELKERMEEERPAEWGALPDLALYMDQIISYMPRQLIPFEESDNLTSAMVNNYIKDGLLPRADGKRYGRVHLAYLTAICALKQVLSVREVGTLLESGGGGHEPEHLYEYFRKELDAALDTTAKSLDENTSEDDLAKLALTLTLRSYADKLAAIRVLDALHKYHPVEGDGRRKK
ncbi:MAG: DUF1836 domain-containing protein [Oscillospiraceae bacterium]